MNNNDQSTPATPATVAPATATPATVAPATATPATITPAAPPVVRVAPAAPNVSLTKTNPDLDPNQQGWINRSRDTATDLSAAITSAIAQAAAYEANGYGQLQSGLKTVNFGANNQGKTPTHAADHVAAVKALAAALATPIAPGGLTIAQALARWAKPR